MRSQCTMRGCPSFGDCINVGESPRHRAPPTMSKNTVQSMQGGARVTVGIHLRKYTAPGRSWRVGDKAFEARRARGARRPLAGCRTSRCPP
eukprot:1336393-Pyramimonas_sp.AAC.1